MLKILSLDVSSISTGFAVIEDGKVLDAYGLIEPNAKLEYGGRLLFFQDEVRKLIQLYKPNIVAIENIFKGRNMTTFKSLSMFRGVAVKTIYEEINKDPVNILAVEARSELNLDASKDKAFKQAIKKFKLKRFNFNFNKHNDIVDAIILGLAIHSLLEKGTDERSLRGLGSKKKRRPKGNKKRLPKAGDGVSSGQKS